MKKLHFLRDFTKTNFSSKIPFHTSQAKMNNQLVQLILVFYQTLLIRLTSFSAVG